MILDVNLNQLHQLDPLEFTKRIPSGQATLVYLDPPWGSRFLWNEVFHSPPGKGEFEAPKIEDYWQLLAELAQQAQRILEPNGALYFRLPTNDVSDGRLIFGQVFASQPWMEIDLPVQQVRTAGSRPPLSEKILVYSLGVEPIWNRQFRKLSRAQLKQRFQSSDERGDFRLEVLIHKVDRPSRQFDWKNYRPPTGYSWILDREQLDSLNQQELIVDGTGAPRRKRYAHADSQEEIGTSWDDLPTQPAESVVPGACSIPFADRMIRIATNPGDLIVEPYCRSEAIPMIAGKLARRWLACAPGVQFAERIIGRLEAQHDEGQTSGYLYYGTEESHMLVVQSPPTQLPYLQIGEIRNIQSQLALLAPILSKLSERLRQLSVDDGFLTNQLDDIIAVFLESKPIAYPYYESVVRQWLPLSARLEPNSLRILAQAEFLYLQLDAFDATNYSSFSHQYCLAVENELREKIFVDFKATYSLSAVQVSQVRKHKQNWGWLLDPPAANITLGTVVILLKMDPPKKDNEVSELRQQLHTRVANRFADGFLDTGISLITAIKDVHRNPAAHPNVVSRTDADRCRVDVREFLNHFLSWYQGSG